MPRQPKFTDYEPVTRRGSSSPENDFSIFDPATPTSAAAGEALGAGLAESLYPAPRQQQENQLSSLKRGHGFSFAGLFLFTALVYFRPYELSPSLFWLSTASFWVAFATLAIFILTQLSLENRITIRPIEVKLVFCLLIIAALSMLVAIDRTRTWNSFIEFSKVVAIFIVMINVLRTQKRIKSIILLVIIASAFVAAMGIYDYSVGHVNVKGERIVGVIGGLFDNPNDLALHLVTMIPIALGLALVTRSLILKLVLFVFACLFVGGVVVTFSRGGFIGLLVTIIAVAWNLGRRHKILFGLVGGGIILALVVFAPGAYRDRLATTKDESAAARTDDLKRSLFLTVRHPILGVGMDNYVLYSNAEKATHNAYTQVSSELGIVAACIYVWFLVTPIKRLSRVIKHNGDNASRSSASYLAKCLQASLIGYMVCSFFASVAYLWYVYYIVAYAICLSRLQATRIQEAEPATGLTEQW